MSAAKQLSANFIRVKGFYQFNYTHRKVRRGTKSQRRKFYKRHPRYPFYELGHEPVTVSTLAGRLKDLSIYDNGIIKSDINIGYVNPKVNAPSRLERRSHLKTHPELEKAARQRTIKIPLEQVCTQWLEEKGYEHVHEIIEHYGIFRDLFDSAHFYPALKFSVYYDYDNEFVSPVYFGNKLNAQDVLKEPLIHFDADPDSFYTLIAVNIDGHLEYSDAEYLLWKVANIPGSSIEEGDICCPYLPPFPPRGTGFHRCVFILFHHSQRILFTEKKVQSNSLSDRSFRTLEFYRQYEDVMTPVDLVFFQTQWDESVRKTFHYTLDMKEPAYEFMHPPPYHPAQVLTPHKEPFNLYLDRYRDTKCIAEEVLKERLKLVSPFDGPVQQPKYPNTIKIPMTTPQWLRTKMQYQRLGVSIWKRLYDNTMDPDK